MTRRNVRSETPAQTLEAMREQLRLELRADVLAGRGRLPRDRSGRADVLAGRGLVLGPAVERPGLQNLAELLATVAIAPAVELPAHTRVARLEALERDLERLLSNAAPHLWRQIRAPIRRLLNRARRELRAIDRADFTRT